MRPSGPSLVSRLFPRSEGFALSNSSAFIGAASISSTRHGAIDVFGMTWLACASGVWGSPWSMVTRTDER